MTYRVIQRGDLWERFGQHDTPDWINIAVEKQTFLQQLGGVPFRIWIAWGCTGGVLVGCMNCAAILLTSWPATKDTWPNMETDGLRITPVESYLRSQWTTCGLEGEFPLSWQELDALVGTLRPDSYLAVEVS